MVSTLFTLGNNVETCNLPLGYWSITDYLRQWETALLRVVHHHSKAALITSVDDVRYAVNCVAWVIYPIDDCNAAIQQHLLLDRRLIVDRLNIDYDSIPDREVISDTGERISEWEVTLVDLQAEANKLHSFIDALDLSSDPRPGQQ